MLKELRRLLPEFTINKDGNVYDIKRQKPDGEWLHIPAIITKAETAETVATSVREAWAGRC